MTPLIVAHHSQVLSTQAGSYSVPGALAEAEAVYQHDGLALAAVVTDHEAHALRVDGSLLPPQCSRPSSVGIRSPTSIAAPVVMAANAKSMVSLHLSVSAKFAEHTFYEVG